MTPFCQLPRWPRHQGQIDELVAHVDEGVTLALATQGEREEAAIPFKGRIDVAYFDRDVIDADQSRFAAFAHARPPGNRADISHGDGSQPCGLSGVLWMAPGLMSNTAVTQANEIQHFRAIPGGGV
jgi:hypothetical protein